MVRLHPNERSAHGVIAAVVLLWMALPASALDPTKAISQYSVRNWRHEEGLPQNSVHAIAQTPDGYVWVATQEGIARFDGEQFTTVFDPRHPEDARATVVALHTASDGALWAGGSGGLIRFQNGTATTWGTRDGLADSYVRAIAEGPDGTIWAATHAGGLSRIRDGKVENFTIKDGLSANSIWSLATGRDGSLWIGTNGGGLSRMRGSTFTNLRVADGLSHDVVWAVHEDRQGVVWIGTNRGLCQFRDGRLVRVRTIDDVDTVPVRALFEDREGTMWIGTDGRGIVRYVNGRFSRARPGDPLATASVEAFREDVEGSLWVGTTTSGLSQLRSGKFTMYGVPEGLVNDEIWALVEGRDGAVWVGTNNGLGRIHNGVITNAPRNGETAPLTIRSLSESRDGSIWITGHGDIARYSRGAMTPYPKLLSHGIARVVVEDRSGTLWIGTRGAGLKAIRDGKVTVYDTSKGLVNDVVMNIVEDTDGSIWIATFGGVSRFHQGVFTNYTRREGLSSHSARAIHHDGDTHWVGTYGGGLNRIRNGKVSVIREKDGLFDDIIHTIIDDGHGNLWMSSNHGISRVDKQSLNDFADGKIASVRSIVYDSADGMRNSECNSGSPAAIRTRDGRLWFATLGGVAVIDPAAIPRNTIAPTVWNQTVLLDGRPVQTPAARLTLETGRHTLEIRYAAMTFTAPKKAAYRYRLKGFSDEWVEAGNRRAAYYTNLPPGDYTFEVKGSNDDGVWSLARNPISIHVEPTLLQTGWFWTAVVIAALLLIHVGVKMRVRILQERERELAVRVEEQTAQLSHAKESAENSAELILRLSRHNRLILDSAAEGIFGLDPDGLSTFVNPSAAHTLGYTVPDLVGRDLHQLIHADDGGSGPLHKCAICSNTHEPPTRIGRDHLFRRRDGSSFPVEYTVSAIVDELGASEGVVVTFRDITERCAVERLKGEFISTVSHELRTPLTAIRGALGLLQSGMIGTMAPRGQRMLDLAVSNTDRLVRLISDILDQERIESGQLVLVPAPADAHVLASEAVEGVRVVADKAGVELVVETVHETLTVDSDRITQTLTNLLSNAIKFSPRGSRVTIGGESHDHAYVFHVADQGRGIPKEMLESIFERFRQVDASDSRQKGGTGLGLSICRSIVDAHRGRIWAESGPSGSTFRFSIPHTAVTDTEAEAPVARAV